jgi:FtsP/CotA-like multicopper oxidase with cupredoxin domain
MMAIADARQRPEVCLSTEGVLSPACPEIEKATLNGQWGDGSKGWPSPVVEVQKGKCYRLRFLSMASAQHVTFKVSVEQHQLEVLPPSSTGTVSEVELRTGDGMDAILCANKQSLLKHEFEIKTEYVGASGSKTFSATLRYISSNATLQQSPKSLAKKEAELQQPPKRVVNDESNFDPSQCEVHQYFDMREQIVDYLRPTVDLGGKATRKPVDQIPLSNRKEALLVNNSYPGPVVEAVEGQLICVTVMNNFASDPVAIHWHGQHMKGFPAFDGVYGVHQGAITPGSSMTYRWRANAGTHLWHGHMQALQADKGMKGPIVIHAKNDPHKHLYDEERIVALSDEWVNPGVCLRKEGAQPGNPVCAEIEKATWNGVWGDGSDEYPWPMVTVEKGKCYRLRFIGMMGQAQNFQIGIAGHDMTLIAVDGADVEPVKVSEFNLHAGERADVVVCANQEPGNYLMSANYDLANFLETAPAPKMPKVDSSKFWAFLNYAGHTEKPGHASKKLLGGYNPPAGTGGGVSPKPSSGFSWDTNLQSAWGKVKNLNAVNEPEKADVTYTLNVGIAHPAFTPGVTPYASSDRMYMFTDIKPWKKPETPLLHTKGECGAEDVPYITVPENATTVEVILNNLSPTAHVLHMHGMRFSVINYAPFSETWCSNAHFECFFLPLSITRLLHCKNAILGDNATDGPGNEYWGCPYDPAHDVKSQNLQNPLQKDMLSLWRRSWAVIRFKVDNPGVWLFHCHMEQHIPTGQIMAFSLLPSKQPPIPSDVPSEGPCPIWSGRDAPVRPPKRSQFFV